MTTLPLLGGALQWPTLLPRPSEDAFWLAACVPSLPKGTAVLDMGCGSGAVALALGARQAGLVFTGLDNDATELAAAHNNAKLNGQNFTPLLADALNTTPATQWPVVVCNPPFHARARGHSSPLPRKAQAHGLTDLAAWVKAWAAYVSPGGTLYGILHTQLAAELTTLTQPYGGQLSLAPLATHPSRPPKRMVVCWQGLGAAYHAPHWCQVVPSYHSAYRQAVLEQAAPLVAF